MAKRCLTRNCSCAGPNCLRFCLRCSSVSCRGNTTSVLSQLFVNSCIYMKVSSAIRSKPLPKTPFFMVPTICRVLNKTLPAITLTALVVLSFLFPMTVRLSHTHQPSKVRIKYSMCDRICYVINSAFLT